MRKGKRRSEETPKHKVRQGNQKSQKHSGNIENRSDPSERPKSQG